ncbi:MAG: ATP-binding protein [Bacteroidales bacterium]|nr:ATP-binding protein [Bacteroidales bacterium]
MDSIFTYEKPIGGRNLIGRQKECSYIGNMLASGENIVMYGGPKTGKTSVIKQALTDMKIAGRQHMLAEADFSSARELTEFLQTFGTRVLSAYANSEEGMRSIVERHLEGTHFVFDRKRYQDYGEALSLNWEPDTDDMTRLFALPGKLAAESGTKLILLLENFDATIHFKENEYVYQAFSAALKERDRNFVSFIFTGSHINAMRYIFRERRFFCRLVEHFILGDLDDRDIMENIVKGFLVTGKVIEKDIALGISRMFRQHMWYINHLCSICDYRTKGYINSNIVSDAVAILISVHEPYFKALMDDLTNHQANLLKASLEGVKRFSSGEVIEKYGLNSSANVRRVKDALQKKEILYFTDNDEPVIIDPLFEYWLRNNYYRMG